MYSPTKFTPIAKAKPLWFQVTDVDYETDGEKIKIMCEQGDACKGTVVIQNTAGKFDSLHYVFTDKKNSDNNLSLSVVKTESNNIWFRIGTNKNVYIVDIPAEQLSRLTNSLAAKTNALIRARNQMCPNLNEFDRVYLARTASVFLGNVAMRAQDALNFPPHDVIFALQNIDNGIGIDANNMVSYLNQRNQHLPGLVF